jgi:hypothetical protein
MEPSCTVGSMLIPNALNHWIKNNLMMINNTMTADVLMMAIL